MRSLKMPELLHRQAILQIVPKQGDFELLKGFRISFKIEKTSESTPNPAKIKIFNLNQDKRALFENKDQTIILQVGYLGLTASVLKTLFTGDIISAKTSKKGPDLVTEIEAGDGEKKLVETFVNKSYSGDRFKSGGDSNATATTRDIVKDLIKSLGLIPNPTKEKEVDKKLELVSTTIPTHGVTMSGPAKFYLDTLLEEEGLEWSIQNGDLNVQRKEDSGNNTNAILLNKLTGLLDVAKEEENKVNFKALLNPEISPSKILKIQSQIMSVNGFYRVQTATYFGDTHEGQWIVKGEAS